MYDSLSKQLVSDEMIRLTKEILDSERIAPSQASLAGLGGHGHSMKAWFEAGFAPEHIYVIERDRRRAKRLMQDGVFHGAASSVHFCQAALRHFPRIFAAEQGDEAGVDVFDLDFDGAFSSATKDIEAITPLVRRGRGRILTLTVADARRNQLLEDPVETAKHVQTMFLGDIDSLESAWRRLCAEHASCVAEHVFLEGFNPIKGAFRELATIVLLAEIAHRHGLEIDSNHGKRFIYTGDAGFRMRSFFLRFQPRGSCSLKTGVLAFLQKECFYVEKDRVVSLVGAAGRLDTPRFSDIAEGRFRFMTSRQERSNSTLPDLATPSSPPDFNILSKEDREFVQRGLGLFDKPLNEAFQDLLRAANGQDLPEKQLKASRQYLKRAGLSLRFREIIAGLERRIDPAMQREGFLEELSMRPFFHDFRDDLLKAFKQAAYHVCDLAKKRGLTDDQARSLLFGQPSGASPVESGGCGAKREKRLVARRSSRGNEDRRTMTPTLVQKDKSKDKSLDAFIAMQGKAPQDQEAIVRQIYGQMYDDHRKAVRSALAHWSGRLLTPSCIVYLACATTEEEMSRRYQKLVRAFSIDEVLRMFAERDTVRFWRERVQAEPNLLLWCQFAALADA